MKNIGTLPGERLAGLASDTFHKVQKGIISLDEWALFNQRKNPFAFKRNEHGHIVITITGLNLTGAQEIERLEAAGYHVTDYAKFCFTIVKVDGYDENHRLVAGQQYKIALLPGKEISRDFDRSTENLRALGTKFGYGKPLGGFIPRIREAVSDKQMEEMGVRHITSLHDPIKDSGGNPSVLNANQYDGGPWVNACWAGPSSQWSDGSAFAFPVSAS